jgi:hypothetical protein
MIISTTEDDGFFLSLLKTLSSQDSLFSRLSLSITFFPKLSFPDKTQREN